MTGLRKDPAPVLPAALPGVNPLPPPELPVPPPALYSGTVGMLVLPGGSTRLAAPVCSNALKFCWLSMVAVGGGGAPVGGGTRMSCWGGREEDP